ncbi:MAG: winged helix-turn-helix domain-containing protein [Candidatus Bathyarchaeota archaeon]|nr:winged helix-turn-helix domain-containing protein [Candidatus Bathyarchaeota archaeon]
MPKSKLEVNLDILKILASQGPMELTKLMNKADLGQSVLEQHLDFLIQQNLVEEQNLGKDETFHVITERGLRVLKVVVPIIEVARKIPALLH